MKKNTALSTLRSIKDRIAAFETFDGKAKMVRSIKDKIQFVRLHKVDDRLLHLIIKEAKSTMSEAKDAYERKYKADKANRPKSFAGKV